MKSGSSRWHFLDSGFCTGAANMECDETLAQLLMRGEILPTVRLFRWRPWAISLGRNQNIDEIDIGRAATDGIDVVRRPTGGRAILHAEELTYSVVMPAPRGTVLDAYNAISSALVHGLLLYGADVTLARSQPNFPTAYRNPSSIPCFSASARYEIEWKGRKLVGSAQRRYGSGGTEIVLQHGSILCGPAHRQLVRYVAVQDASVEGEIARSLEERTADLTQILSRAVVVEDLVQCIRRGFESAWGITLSPLSHSSIDEISHVAL
jgi:lipoyl(octanoyl) transferase